MFSGPGGSMLALIRTARPIAHLSAGIGCCRANWGKYIIRIEGHEGNMAAERETGKDLLTIIICPLNHINEGVIIKIVKKISTAWGFYPVDTVSA